MRSVTSVAIVCALATTLVVPSSASAKLLSQVVQHALATHPEIKREKARRRSAEKLIDQQFSGYLPTVDLEGATGFEYTNSPTTRNRNGAGARNDPSGRDLYRNDASVGINQMI